MMIINVLMNYNIYIIIDYDRALGNFYCACNMPCYRHLLCEGRASHWMGYDRGDSFLFDFEPNGIRASVETAWFAAFVAMPVGRMLTADWLVIRTSASATAKRKVSSFRVETQEASNRRNKWRTTTPSNTGILLIACHVALLRHQICGPCCNVYRYVWLDIHLKHDNLNNF